MQFTSRALASALLLVAPAAWAQTIAPAGTSPTPSCGASAGTSCDVVPGVPVYPYDITDRPYTVLGEIKAGVRKATMFSKSPSQEKIYRELWERGRKLGADAVVNAKYGNAHVTALSWGKANATGTAVKFTAPANPTN